MPATATTDAESIATGAPKGSARRGDPKSRVARQTGRPTVNPLGSLVERDDGVGVGNRVERFAQPAGRQRPRAVHVLPGDRHQIDVPVQLKVLKPIVQDVDGAAEMMLRQTTREVAIAARQHGDAIQLSGEHHGLVAGSIDVGRDAIRIADDDHAVVMHAAGISTAQNGRAFADGREAWMRSAATSGVLARPPTARLPMLMTGRARRRCRSGWFA